MGNVINIQQSGGLGITAKPGDAISGMVLHVPAPPEGTNYVLGGVYKLGSTKDLEDVLGVTAAFDEENEVNAYQSVLEFFTINPKGTLYVMFITQSATLLQILNPTVSDGAIKLVNQAEGKIKQLAITYTLEAEDYEAVFTAAIAQAQVFAEYCAEISRPLHIVLEGFGLDGTTNLKALNSGKVSVMLGQNDTFYSSGEFAELHTAIGSLLGVISLARVNDNIGWVGQYNMMKGNLQNARIGGVLIDDISPTVFDTLDEKGYIYFKKFIDYSGIYMNDSYTCTDETDDYSKIEKNRTWNKASRLIRTAMLPYVNSTVFINTDNGQIDSVTISAMEAAGNKALQPMFQNGEISGPDPNGPTPPFRIDPDQDILATEMLNTELSIVPTGVASTITNYIGFKNPNN